MPVLRDVVGLSSSESARRFHRDITDRFLLLDGLAKDRVDGANEIVSRLGSRKDLTNLDISRLTYSADKECRCAAHLQGSRHRQVALYLRGHFALEAVVEPGHVKP